MSDRLGRALARHILDLPGDRNFVMVEGVDEDLASALSEAWGDAPLRLAVASAHPERFGDRALRGQSGTALRNEGPVCLVVCEGAPLPDRQSLRAFQSIAPSDLLADHGGLVLMARQVPSSGIDGPARQVRGAIIQAGAAARPSANAVADYLDRCGAAEDPLHALPALGAFADHAAGGDRVDQARILENLRLAARLRTEPAGRPGDLRRRTRRILSRRPELSDADAAELAERVLVMLQTGEREVLSTLTYDEASEILEQKSSDLSAAAAAAELHHYRQTARDAEEIAWERYEEAARLLRDPAEQKPAARDLINFDMVQAGAVFEPDTRRRLERVLKDRVLSASRPSCPELAILRAAMALGGIAKIELREPIPRADGNRRNRTSASQEIVLACCRLRLGQLFRDLQEEGVEIDGALLRPAHAEWDEIFQDAQLGSGGPPLTPILLRLRSRDGSESRMISWRPDLDDIAALRGALIFAEQPALTLRARSAPTLSSFCSGPPPEPEPVPAELAELASALQRAAEGCLGGLRPSVLTTWADAWTAAAAAEEDARRADHVAELSLAGGVAFDQECALTPLAPLKAEWLAQYLDALWSMIWLVQQAGGERSEEPGEETAVAIARSTATHYPAHLRLRSRDKPLLPTGEGRIWSVYGAALPDSGQLAGEALEAVIERLLRLQPDAAGHLRCLAYGPDAGTLLVQQAIELVGRHVGRATLRKLELFCIDEGGGRPSDEALALADEAFAGEAERPFELRYLSTLDDALAMRRDLSPGSPIVHLALITGLSGGGGRLTINTPEIDQPPLDPEVLFAPRTWTRPRQQRRMLLAPPATSPAGGAWLRLMNAVEDEWPEPGAQIRAPELQTASSEFRDELLAVHDLSLWVATLDPYASRDSLTHALGDEVAILHQDRRLGGDSPLSLVISQKSGGPVDNAVGRTLRSARIVDDFDQAREIGASLRKVASDGYGVLALEAATTGAGINELVGHVVAFSLLATHTTPWPLPPNCRVLLVSLDDYKHWFPSKRADLLVFALDTVEGGVHVAAIEVKARRSDVNLAARDALDQLRQTLNATRFAAYPGAGSIHSRLWLNRLAEAACAVARESNFRLDADELQALENFRLGRGTLEWAGLGLVFGPSQEEFNQHYQQEIAGDRIPIVVNSVRLTEQLLRDAASVELTALRTVDAERPPLEGGRVRRRPERRPIEPVEEPQEPAEAPSGPTPLATTPAAPTEGAPAPVPGSGAEDMPSEPSAQADRDSPVPPDAGQPTEPAQPRAAFEPPILGWDATIGEPVLWRAAGPDAVLDNGHTEIWGASGAGKTQFTMSLLAQLAAHTGAHFGIANFKNDYSDSGSDRFPERVGARFLNLWNPGAPFNPLALESADDREIARAIIEIRDIVDVATQSFTRMGHRQKEKLYRALEGTYAVGRQEGTWPTLRTLNDQLDDDLRAVIGDLTRYEIFRDGPPLGRATNENLVFGLYDIPGNGLTTILAAGFILSALHLRIQGFPQVANTIKYVTVVDEAHRVAAFSAVKSMLREGRSKGLAVLLATQQPGDLPEKVSTNANTRICFRLPDATIAAAAGRRLDNSDRSLSEQIRTLDRGEALVSLAGSQPQLLRMAQFWRDREALRLPEQPQPS